ncbi:MAG: NUDIX domain-containing protein [Ignavibacteria bacterium]|jgi:nucleoside triphosphatase
MSNYPELTVGAVIFNPDNKILLCKSSKWNNKYVIPGGHVEAEEKMENALRREIKEETGLDIYDIKLISLQESIFSKTFNGKHHFIFVDYFCRTDSLKVTLNDEAEEYVWAELENILNFDLGGFTRNFFEEYLKGNSQHKIDIFYNYVTEQ